MNKEYTETKQKIREIENSLIHNITGLMFFAGIKAGYKTKQEFKDHFNELVSESNRKHIFKDKDVSDNFYRDLFLDNAFFYINNVPNYLDSDTKIGTTTFITGNDGDLQYFHECNVCHSVIIVDHSDESCMYPIVCKHCHPDVKRSHRIIEVGTEEWEKGQKWFTHEKRMNTDEAYRSWNEFKSKVWHKWYGLTKWFRPGYWRAIKKWNEMYGKKKLKKNEEAKQLLVG